MKIFTSLFFLISLVGSAWAGVFPGGGPPVIGGAPGPEMSAGIVGMTLAAGVVYLLKRRKRS
jgi:LPXTG-motif cell wall-anchored protein